MSAIPFSRFEHLVAVPVTVGDIDTRFILDTGIGLTLLSSALAEKTRCVPDGRSYAGRRMSGQEVTVPLARLERLTVGSMRRTHLDVGVFDLGLEGIDGFLALEFFRAAPFTVDYSASEVVLESAASLAARAEAGAAVPLHVRDEGCSLDPFLSLDLPDGQSIVVEADMGSDALILDERFAAALGVELDGADVRRVSGSDETGHPYTRFFTRIAGTIHPTGAPGIAQHDPEVMFQQIVHDGLLGDAFLRRFAVTYDVAGSRIVFAAGD